MFFHPPSSDALPQHHYPLISYIISNNKHEIINLEKIYVSFEDYQLAKNGFHFVGLNTDIKKFWYLHNTKFM